jgi:hypothetical protein
MSMIIPGASVGPNDGVSLVGHGEIVREAVEDKSRRRRRLGEWRKSQVFVGSSTVLVSGVAWRSTTKLREGRATKVGRQLCKYRDRGEKRRAMLARGGVDVPLGKRDEGTSASSCNVACYAQSGQAEQHNKN